MRSRQSARDASRKQRAAVIMVCLLCAMLVVGGVFAGKHLVGASTEGTTQITGAVSRDESGTIQIDDGSVNYTVVAGFDLAGFVDRTVEINGSVEEGVLYAFDLTLGAISIHGLGDPTVDLTGTVDSVETGYQTTVDGISFALQGDDLEQYVGQTVMISGALVGMDVTITDLTVV